MILTLNVTTDLFATAKAYAESINADKVGPCLDCVRTMLASPPSASSLPTPLLQTRIFTLSPGAYRWLCAMAKPPRPLDSVILDTNVADELVADVQDFFQRKVRGLAVRRTFDDRCSLLPLPGAEVVRGSWYPLPPGLPAARPAGVWQNLLLPGTCWSIGTDHLRAHSV